MKVQQFLKEKFFENNTAETVRNFLEDALATLTASDRFAQWSGTARADATETILHTAQFIDDLESDGDFIVIPDDPTDRAAAIRADISGAVSIATHGKGLTTEQQEQLTAKVAAFLQAETIKTEAAATDPAARKNVTVNIEKLIDVLHVTPPNAEPAGTKQPPA